MQLKNSINGEIQEQYNGQPNKKTPRETIQLVLKRLQPLGAFVYYYAVTGSVYIKFRSDELRSSPFNFRFKFNFSFNISLTSLVFQFHNIKEKYKYKWNLRKDLKAEKETLVDRGITRYYYRWDQWEALCSHIEAYAKAIECNTKAVRKENRDNVAFYKKD